MHASVSETWFVLDVHALKSPILAGSLGLAEDFSRKHLLDGLDSVIESSERRSLDGGGVLIDIQCIGLFRH